MMEWERTIAGNYLLVGDATFTVSFQPDTMQFGDFLGGDTQQETALCKDGKYYILNGDHRKEYEKLISSGFKACKAYFDSKPELRSRWSN